jgi:hypothetical protein
MKKAIIVLIGCTSLAVERPAQVSPSAGLAHSGPVSVQGRAIADAKGPFNALGATLFWGAWGYKFDQPRLKRSLAALEGAGIDYIRVLGTVGGPSWSDRPTDARWADYDAVIAGLTDLAYDEFGLRVQWTIFGGAPFTADPDTRQQLVDRFAAMARGREHKIVAFEIANEGWQTGFAGSEGIEELRRLGMRLNDQADVLVALSAPQSKAACELYGGSGADVMTLHYSRAFGTKGPLQPLVKPWSWTSYGAGCANKMPPVVFNNEPIGPESSVQQDDAPSRIVAAYVMTFLAGNAAYVFHAGPGIRGGGKADVTGDLRRHAHFDELPTFARIATGLKAAKDYLPPGLANWKRYAPNATGAPVRGFAQLYSASSGANFVALAVGVEAPVTLHVVRSAAIEVRAAESGQVVTRVDAKAGEPFTLPAGEAFVLIGHVGGN